MNRLEEISIRNQQLWVDIKAMMLEWMAYYIYSSTFPSNSVKWDIEKSIGEIDVFIEGPERLKLIECKVNSGNCDLKKECDK